MSLIKLLSGTFLSMVLLSAFLNTGYRLPAQIHQVTAAPMAAHDTLTPDSVYMIPDQMPAFPGGMQGLSSYLSSNIRYPAEALKAKEKGRVYVSFVIAEDGKITEVRVVQGVSPALDAEAVRVISSMPNWIPGKFKNRNIPVGYTLPITFSL